MFFFFLSFFIFFFEFFSYDFERYAVLSLFFINFVFLINLRNLYIMFFFDSMQISLIFLNSIFKWTLDFIVCLGFFISIFLLTLNLFFCSELSLVTHWIIRFLLNSQFLYIKLCLTL